MILCNFRTWSLWQSVVHLHSSAKNRIKTLRCQNKERRFSFASHSSFIKSILGVVFASLFYNSPISWLMYLPVHQPKKQEMVPLTMKHHKHLTAYKMLSPSQPHCHSRNWDFLSMFKFCRNWGVSRGCVGQSISVRYVSFFFPFQHFLSCFTEADSATVFLWWQRPPL